MCYFNSSRFAKNLLQLNFPAKKLGMIYIETSAKEKIRSDEPFEMAVRIIRDPSLVSLTQKFQFEILFCCVQCPSRFTSWEYHRWLWLGWTENKNRKSKLSVLPKTIIRRICQYL